MAALYLPAVHEPFSIRWKPLVALKHLSPMWICTTSFLYKYVHPMQQERIKLLPIVPFRLFLVDKTS
jgi:hypothetical protein